MKNKLTFFAVLVAVLLAGGLWFFSPHERTSDADIEAAFVPQIAMPDAGAGAATAPGSAPVSAPSAVPAGYRQYTNEQYHFSLALPPDIRAQEYKESVDAMTITFEDSAGENSFQIFITPYDESTITKERFKLDAPSGVIKEPTEVMIDSVRATMFFSTNLAMGDTREVWFIKNGFLYEVTTYQELDTWLAQIMHTWKFI